VTKTKTKIKTADEKTLLRTDVRLTAAAGRCGS